MLKKFKMEHYLLIIFIVNLIQAFFTPLMGDEVYYWVYSQDLAWGYFDHPPAISFIVKLSDFLFSNELSIRFFTTILNTLTAFLIWKLIPEQNKNQQYSKEIFFALFLMIPGLSMYGFITTPDVPLLFFFALYLVAFNFLIEKNNFKSAIFVGLCAALLIYSKYHGAILILLSIVSNWKVLTKKYYYLAGFIAVVFVLPHIYWQYLHDFVSFDYHLFQRAKGEIGIHNVLDYVGGSLGILNPFLFLFVIFYSFKKSVSFSEQNIFYRNMFFGIIIFFFFYSFRSKIEAQWTVAAAIPLLILAHDLLVNYWFKFQKLRYLGFGVLIILFTVRIIIMLPFDSGTEFHHHQKPYFDALAKKVGNKKVVFSNSYRDAAKYKFYTGKDAMALSNYHYRKSQFDVGNYDISFNEQPVFFVGYTENIARENFNIENENVKYALIPNFPVYNKIIAKIKNTNLSFAQKENVLEIEIKNKHNYDFDFKENKHEFQIFMVLIFKEENYFFPITFPENTMKANAEYMISTNMNFQEIPKGKYTSMLVMRSKFLQPTLLSRSYTVQIQ